MADKNATMEVVYELNDWFYSVLGDVDDLPYLEYHTTGAMESITLGSHYTIWCSEDDDRLYTKENEQESILSYVRRKLFLYIDTLNKLPRYIDSTTVQTAEEKFRTLVLQWKNEKEQEPEKFPDIYINSNYQMIIGMGQEAVPLIIREFIQRPDHWDWALRAITCADPVKKEHGGNLKLMSMDWFQWGVENFYVKT